MSRIRKAYETRFRALLRELNSRRIDQGVRWWSNHVQQLSQRDGISLTHAFEQSVCLLRQRVDAFSERRSQPGDGHPAPVSRIKNAAMRNSSRRDACLTCRCAAGLGALG